MKATRKLGVLGRLFQQVWFDSTVEVAASVNQQEVGHRRDTLVGRRHLLEMDSRHQEGGGPTNTESESAESYLLYDTSYQSHR